MHLRLRAPIWERGRAFLSFILLVIYLIDYLTFYTLQIPNTNKQFFSYIISVYRGKVEGVTIKTLEFAYFEKAGE
jgi:hypothetical protein